MRFIAAINVVDKQISPWQLDIPAIVLCIRYANLHNCYLYLPHTLIINIEVEALEHYFVGFPELELIIEIAQKMRLSTRRMC